MLEIVDITPANPNCLHRHADVPGRHGAGELVLLEAEVVNAMQNSCQVALRCGLLARQG